MPTTRSKPNYVFRLSLRDSLAMPFMLQDAAARGMRRVGLLLTNTAGGRSNLAAAQKYAGERPTPVIAGVAWYNWTDPSLADKYNKLVAAGAEAVLLVANADEAALLVREVARLDAARRTPFIQPLGRDGGRFVEAAGRALAQVDFSVIQTFSFFQARPEPLKRFMATTRKVARIERAEQIESPVGVAHAYDMTHILAKAISLARSADRAKVRDALERVRSPEGLVAVTTRRSRGNGTRLWARSN